MCAGVGLRYYKVPQDLHGEEKLIGGLLLPPGCLCGGQFYRGCACGLALPISLVNKAGVASLLVVPGIALGFVTVQGMNLISLLLCITSIIAEGSISSMSEGADMVNVLPGL